MVCLSNDGTNDNSRTLPEQADSGEAHLGRAWFMAIWLLQRSRDTLWTNVRHTWNQPTGKAVYQWLAKLNTIRDVQPRRPALQIVLCCFTFPTKAHLCFVASKWKYWNTASPPCRAAAAAAVAAAATHQSRNRADITNPHVSQTSKCQPTPIHL